jgi:hypothetical protein
MLCEPAFHLTVTLLPSLLMSLLEHKLKLTAMQHCILGPLAISSPDRYHATPHRSPIHSVHTGHVQQESIIICTCGGAGWGARYLSLGYTCAPPNTSASAYAAGMLWHAQ